MGEKSEILRTFVTLIMKKKSNDRRKTRGPGKTGATGIIKRTDTAERPVRTGKTGATGIIRETGTNGMSFEKTDSANQLTKKELGSNGKPSKGGRKHTPVILVTNDD